MGRRKRSGSWVVTTFGADGACAAAMLLLARPEARIVVTSTSRGAESLAELLKAARPGAEIHVCGLGFCEEAKPALDALDRLAAAGALVTWYCGRGYLGEMAPELSRRCTAVLKPCASNTEAVFRHLGLPRNRQSALLLDLAAEFVDKTDPGDEDHQWWQDFIKAAAERYFKYDDAAAFPSLIRKLAGLDETTALDQREVRIWRDSGGKGIPLGNSPAIKKLRADILRLAPLDEPVLVRGPTGAGKELAARLLHEASPRGDGHFVPVNCAVLSASSDLAHDRLFGHKAGAYTGAERDGMGAFEAADDGTLFLDEVAEIPLDVQAQLLRTLEEGTILPLGTVEPRPVKVRVVAATHRDLAAMVREGRFRADLYYRLNVLNLTLPPLRERREDMKTIANALLHQLREAGHPLRLGRDDWLAIDNYDWPGNIRQFQNVLKRAAYLEIPAARAVAEEIENLQPLAGEVPAASALSGRAPLPAPFWPADADGIRPERELRRAYLRHCLGLCQGSWTLAARRLGLSVNTLRKWTEG